MKLRLHKSHIVSSPRAGVLPPFGGHIVLLGSRAAWLASTALSSLEAYAMSGRRTSG
jgi:hypothetical protein